MMSSKQDESSIITLTACFHLLQTETSSNRRDFTYDKIGILGRKGKGGMPIYVSAEQKRSQH